VPSEVLKPPLDVLVGTGSAAFGASIGMVGIVRRLRYMCKGICRQQCSVVVLRGFRSVVVSGQVAMAARHDN